MRKLTKKALSLVLCVMLVVSAFSCAFGVFAEEVGSTEVAGMTVYDAPVELDFSGSLETWINNTTDGGTQRFVAGNGVLKAGSDITTYGGWANPVSSAYFKIPDITAGSGIQFSLDLAVDPAMVSGHANYNWEMLRIQYKQFNADGSVKSAPAYASYSAVQYAAGTKTSPVFTIDDPDEFFQIIIYSPKNPGFAWSLSNFDMAITDAAYEFEFDVLENVPGYYGTADNGFSSFQTTSYPVYLKPAEAIANLDFEAGFVYWSGENVANAAVNTNVLPSDCFKLVPEGDNIYLDVKNAGYVSNIQTTFFDLSEKLQTGDTVVLIYDAMGEDATKIRPLLKQDGLRPVEYDEETGKSTTLKEGTTTLWNPSNGETPTEIIGNTAAQTEFPLQVAEDGWTTYMTAPATIFAPNTYNDTASDGIYLQVKVAAANGITAGTELDAQIDNIRIAKVVDGVYYDLATDEEIFDASSLPPSYYGTEKDGFYSQYSSYPLALKPVEGIENLDFEQGFVYWSGKKHNSPSDPGSYASDSFKLVDDGTNKYVTLKDEGYVNTMRSALFRVENVEVGDHLVIVYDAKGADIDRLRMVLLQQHLRGEDNGVTYDEGTGLYDGSAGSATPGTPTYLVDVMAGRIALDELPAPEGWTTYVTDFNDAVIDPTTLGNTRVCIEDIFLQVIVDKSNSVYAGDKLDAAIDNIRIAKVVDGLYYDIATGEPIAPVVEHPEAEVNADTLAWLVSLVMAGDTDPAADYNGDGNVDLLDIVVLKKRLTAIY